MAVSDLITHFEGIVVKTQPQSLSGSNSPETSSDSPRKARWTRNGDENVIWIQKQITRGRENSGSESGMEEEAADVELSASTPALSLCSSVTSWAPRSSLEATHDSADQTDTPQTPEAAIILPIRAKDSNTLQFSFPAQPTIQAYSTTKFLFCPPLSSLGSASTHSPVQHSPIPPPCSPHRISSTISVSNPGRSTLTTTSTLPSFLHHMLRKSPSLLDDLALEADFDTAEPDELEDMLEPRPVSVETWALDGWVGEGKMLESVHVTS